MTTAEEAGTEYETETEEAEENNTEQPPQNGDGQPIAIMVDADNGFNNQNWMAMLSTVCHVWPSMAKFTMNFHRHQVRLGRKTHRTRTLHLPPNVRRHPRPVREVR